MAEFLADLQDRVENALVEDELLLDTIHLSSLEKFLNLGQREVVEQLLLQRTRTLESGLERGLQYRGRQVFRGLGSHPQSEVFVDFLLSVPASATYGVWLEGAHFRDDLE